MIDERWLLKSIFKKNKPVMQRVHPTSITAPDFTSWASHLPETGLYRVNV